MVDHSLIQLSDGTSYQADLIVYRDYLESNGFWRLCWQNPSSGNYVCEQSTVTGRPFFRTMAGAVAHGMRHYRIKATRGHSFPGDID